MGPQASKSYPGQRLVRAAEGERATQEIDYGRRGVAGYVSGVFVPAAGAALTATYEGRTTANWIDFLCRVEDWIDPAVGRVYAVVDNLKTHSAMDVLLFNLAYPRWEFVFQPKYAAYLNLIEPWWKVLRSLALKGRRFDAWAEIDPSTSSGGGRTRHGVLERAQAPLRLGSSPTSSQIAPPRGCGPAKCRSHLADEPLTAGSKNTHAYGDPGWAIGH
jgi:hypothetical protein